MNQTKTESLVEALLNTGIGYLFSLALQLIVYPFYGHSFSFAENLKIGVWFLVLSLIRSYVIRRWCNKYLHQFAIYLTGLLNGVKFRLL